MSDFSEILYLPEDSPRACHERELPTDRLSFSNGDPLCPARLRHRNLQCVQSTVATTSFESAQPMTHYWYSQDMAWWFSAAKQIFHDIQTLLTEGDLNATPFTPLSICHLLRHPEYTRLNWLTCFVHIYLGRDGTILQPVRGMIKTPFDETDLPDTLRFDVFLLECWSRMGLDSEQERTTLRRIETLQARFDKRWKQCVISYQRHAHGMPNGDPQSRGCLLLPNPKAYGHIRSKLDLIQEQTGCTVSVPAGGEELIEITGTEEGVEKAKHLILDTWRKNLAGVDVDRDLALARSQYLTAARTLRSIYSRGASNGPGIPGGETTNSGGEMGDEEVELARAAAQDQLFRAQFHLQISAFEALQDSSDQSRRERQGFGEAFVWDQRRPARDHNGQNGDSSPSSATAPSDTGC